MCFQTVVALQLASVPLLAAFVTLACNVGMHAAGLLLQVHASQARPAAPAAQHTHICTQHLQGASGGREVLAHGWPGA
jgi:hypothetical protein